MKNNNLNYSALKIKNSSTKESEIMDKLKIKKGSELEYKKLLSIFSTTENEEITNTYMEDFIDFVIANDEKCDVEFLYRKIELCLKKYKAMEESKGIMMEEIFNILNYRERLDSNYLKMIFKLADFKPGIIEIAKIENNEQEILSFYFEEEEFQKIIQTCITYCSKDKLIWVQAFSYFVNYYDSTQVGEYIKVVLEQIAAYNLLSPIVVLKTLRMRKTISIDIVKNYIAKTMKTKIQEMSVDKKDYEESMMQVKKANKDLVKIREKPILFNCQQCFVCKEPFTNYINANVTNISKIVVFKCHHAFHPLCLNIQEKVEYNTEDYTCPECSFKYEQVNKRIQIIYDNATDHNQFFMQLNKKDNKFDFIAKNLGRGAISNMN